MPAFYEIKFLAEGRIKQFAGSRGNHYELADGSFLDVHSTPVWCHQCKDITHGEKIPTLEEIDQELADLQNPRSELYGFLAKDYDEEFKDLGTAFTRMHSRERERRRRWRSGRVSPPRCIHCGSTDIFIFAVNKVSPNPAGDGTVEVRLAGMCSTDFNNWFFTPEGERIPRNTKPSNWYHPALDKSRGRVRRWLNNLLRKNNRRKKGL